jgi:hypothetical protein
MNTDSIVTNIELPRKYIGTNLGQLKLEDKIKKAYFISSKTYCLVLDKIKLLKRQKVYLVIV